MKKQKGGFFFIRKKKKPQTAIHKAKKFKNNKKYRNKVLNKKTQSIGKHLTAKNGRIARNFYDFGKGLIKGHKEGKKRVQDDFKKNEGKAYFDFMKKHPTAAKVLGVIFTVGQAAADPSGGRSTGGFKNIKW